MLGAIIGDVAGSIYEVLEVDYLKKKHIPRSYEERIKILDKNIPLFNKESSITDDSILTCAIYDAIKNGNNDYEKYLKEYGINELKLGKDKYGRDRFSKGFIEWLNDNNKGDSFGNGAAMRVSPVGYLFDSFYEVKENAKISALPTHNNVEAIKASQAIATSIFLMRYGYTKEKVKEYIKETYYDLDYDLETLQKTNTFSSKAAVSVPQALFVFFESNDFEDAIRKAVSIGGDSDTIASIVGSLSESYYEIPEELIEQVKPYLNKEIYDLLKERYFVNKELLLKK